MARPPAVRRTAERVERLATANGRIGRRHEVTPHPRRRERHREIRVVVLRHRAVEVEGEALQPVPASPHAEMRSVSAKRP